MKIIDLNTISITSDELHSICRVLNCLAENGINTHRDCMERCPLWIGELHREHNRTVVMIIDNG